MNGRFRLAALLVACGSARGAAALPASTPPLPEVEYNGCFAVYLPGPVCALWEDRKINVWVTADPGTDVEIRADRALQMLARKDSQDGRLYGVTIQPGATRLTVQLRRPDGNRSPIWSLQLVEPESHPWLAKVDQLAKAGKNAEISQWLTHLLTTEPRKERGLILRSLAVTAWKNGKSEQAALYFAQGIAADRAERCLSGEIEKATNLARLQMEQGLFGVALETLGKVPHDPQAPFDAKYQLAYVQGLLSDHVGNFRSAFEQLRIAADLASRLGIDEYRFDAEQVLARVLQEVGNTRKAADLFGQLRADPALRGHPCRSAALLTNLGWSRLLAREGGEQVEDPILVLEEAQTLFDGPDCAGPEKRLNARLNLALAYEQSGRWSEARQELRQVDPLLSHANLRERLWRQDLEGRAAIAAGHPRQALGLYGELAKIAEATHSLEGRFRAALGKAHVQRALNRPAQALAELAAANRLVDEQVWQIPVSEGRETFLAQREEATRLSLQILLREGRLRRAFALVRRDRSRLLRQLAVKDRLAQLAPREQARWDHALSSYLALRNIVDTQAADQWKLSIDQVKIARRGQARQLAQALRELDHAVAGLGGPGKSWEGPLTLPRPGEVVLAYHPLLQGNTWVGFAAHERSLEVSTFELPPLATADAATLARLLLEPFREAIAKSERVRVLPYGPLASVDFHALPLAGESLLAHHLVVYSLDLTSRPFPSRKGPQIALLVSDPQGDLAAARQERATVVTAVHAWGSGWSLHSLDGPAADAGKVRLALPDAALFHYAGHGTFAGFAGWDSALKLAESSLTLGDLLALRHAPAWVVLSACDAAHSSDQAPGEGIGIAQAFLLAGSQEVIAATRPVPDRTARDLVGEMYRRWQPGADLPRQFLRAQRACLKWDPAADCLSFRLLEP